MGSASSDSYCAHGRQMLAETQYAGEEAERGMSDDDL